MISRNEICSHPMPRSNPSFHTNPALDDQPSVQIKSPRPSECSACSACSGSCGHAAYDRIERRQENYGCHRRRPIHHPQVDDLPQPYVSRDEGCGLADELPGGERDFRRPESVNEVVFVFLVKALLTRISTPSDSSDITHISDSATIISPNLFFVNIERIYFL